MQAGGGTRARAEDVAVAVEVLSADADAKHRPAAAEEGARGGEDEGGDGGLVEVGAPIDPELTADAEEGGR